jgi:hypothetical protein
MKKHTLLAVAFLAVLALFASTAGAQDVSIGYQGFIGNGQNLLSGLSVRGWTDQIGYEGTIFYGQADIDLGAGADVSADVWILDAQVMYAAIAKEHSKFYVGLDFGYGGYSVEANSVPFIGTGETDDNFWMLGPLVGAEYCFQELPELGFNWEVAYTFGNFENEDASLEVDLSGINVTLGVHYKFN